VRKTISNCPPPPEGAGAVVAAVAVVCAPDGLPLPLGLPPARGLRAVFATKPSFKALRHARSNSGEAAAAFEAAAPVAAFEAEPDEAPDGAAAPRACAATLAVPALEFDAPLLLLLFAAPPCEPAEFAAAPPDMSAALPSVSQ